MRALITGATGFVGHHLVNHILEHTDWEVVGTYTNRHRGDAGRLAPVADHPRLRLVHLDTSAPWGTVGDAIGAVDYVFNLASESHVTRSIADPVPFVQNNVNLALHALEWARKYPPQVFVQFSTDEVFGPVETWGGHDDSSPARPSSPYAASKACQENIAHAYRRTYGVPVVITNTCNIIGAGQDPEKFVPMLARRIAAGETITIHTVHGRPGLRFYIHAGDVAAALVEIAETERPRARYLLTSGQEVDNLEMAQLVGEALGAEPIFRLEPAETTRPGHDARYGLKRTDGWPKARSVREAVRSAVA